MGATTVLPVAAASFGASAAPALAPPDEFARVPEYVAPPPPEGSDAQVSAAALAPAAMTLGVLGILRAPPVPFVFFIAITLGVIGLVPRADGPGAAAPDEATDQRLVTAAVLASGLAIVGGLVGAYLVSL